MLHKLRQKSDHQKRKIAVVASIAISAVIFIFWLSATISSFSALDGDVVDAQGVSIKDTKSPLSVLKDNLASAFDSLSNNADQVKSQILGQ